MINIGSCDKAAVGPVLGCMFADAIIILDAGTTDIFRQMTMEIGMYQEHGWLAQAALTQVVGALYRNKQSYAYNNSHPFIKHSTVNDKRLA